MSTYAPAPELENIAKTFIKKYAHCLPELNVDKIGFLWELDKKAKEENGAMGMGLTKKIDASTKVFFDDKYYVVIVFRNIWDQCSPAQQHNEVFSLLLKCNADGEKLNKPDVVEHFEVAAAIGIDWRFNPDCRDLLVDDLKVISNPYVVTEAT
jgi:putative metallopeptidase